MTFLHGGIALLGLVAATIPIILHLLLKQKPRPLVFPALKLIRKRHTSTVKRLRLRQLILLALRVGLILLLGLALARPTLRSGLLAIDQKAPVAMSLVFDTSLSMEYKEKGKSRLDEAKDLAARVIDSTTEGSEITIVNSANPDAAATGDIASALARLKAVELSPGRRPLNDSVVRSYRALARSQHGRREVYVFTDMAASAWEATSKAATGNGDAASGSGPGARLEAEAALIDANVKVYCIDVGAPSPVNLGIGPIDLPRAVIAEGSPLELKFAVGNRGPVADRTIELTVDGEPRDQRSIQLPADRPTELTLSLSGLPAGVHQGKVAINAADALPFDDARYFTVEVRPPMRTLVVVDDPADAVHWTNALAPETMRRAGDARFIVDVTSSVELVGTDITRYPVITLLNVAALDAAAWTLLDNFVLAGGGLFVGLGERVDRASYDSSAAQAVLPARLDAEVRPAEGTYLAPEQFAHPLLASFRQWGDSDLPELTVQGYWRVLPPPDGARVIVSYANGDPALVERVFPAGRRGRSILLTTAAHYRPSADTWTELPRGWSYLVLAHQLMDYLCRSTDRRLDFLAGQRVLLELDPGRSAGLVTITDPRGEVERVTLDPGATVLAATTAALGNYRVEAADGSEFPLMGFSVNEPVDECDLNSIEPAAIEKLIGKDRLVITRDPAELEGAVEEARVGRELYPWLMLIVLALFAVEGYFANRFYRQAGPTNAGPA